MNHPPKPQVTADRYEEHAFHPLRIESITEQLRQICYSGYTNILEIGVGIGFLRHCFKLFPQISHTTVDIAEDLHPDYVGSVTDMPFEDKQFELTVCGQVLEHLPFTEFLPALNEIRRVTRHRVILSLSDVRRRLGFGFCLPRIGWFHSEWSPARWRRARQTLRFEGEHYWEIGYRGTLRRHVVGRIKQAGFVIEKQYRLFRHPWHSFFILRP